MKKSLLYGFVFLLMLTASTAFFAANFADNLVWPALVILFLSSVKFVTVALQFMELKHAHVAWRVVLFLLLGILMLSIAGMRLAF